MKRQFYGIGKPLPSAGQFAFLEHSAHAAAGTTTGPTASAACGIRQVVQFIDLVKPHDGPLDLVRSVLYAAGSAACRVARSLSPCGRRFDGRRIGGLATDRRHKHVEEVDDLNQPIDDPFQRRGQCLHQRSDQRTQTVFQILGARCQPVHTLGKMDVECVTPFIQVLSTLAEALGDGANHRANQAVFCNAQHGTGKVFDSGANIGKYGNDVVGDITANVLQCSAQLVHSACRRFRLSGYISQFIRQRRHLEIRKPFRNVKLSGPRGVIRPHNRGHIPAAHRVLHGVSCGFCDSGHRL